MNHRSHTLLVLSFGMGQLSSALVDMVWHRDAYVPSVRESHTMVTPIGVENPELLFDETIKDVRSLLSQYSLHGIRIDRIVCCIESPWAHTDVRVAKLSKQKSFRVTEETINTLHAYEMERAYQDALAQNLIVLEQPILSVRIDGIDIPEPLNRRTRNIELVVPVVMTSGALRESLAQVVAQYFKHTPVTWLGDTVSRMSTLRDTISGFDKGMYVALRARSTECVFFENGLIPKIVTLPFGYIEQFRSLATTLPHATHARMFYDGMLDTAAHEKLRSREDAYSMTFKKEIEALLPVQSQPYPVCIGGTAHTKLVTKVTNKLTTIVSSKNCVPVPLDSGMLSHHFHISSTEVPSGDMQLLILYCARLINTYAKD